MRRHTLLRLCQHTWRRQQPCYSNPARSSTSGGSVRWPTHIARRRDGRSLVAGVAPSAASRLRKRSASSRRRRAASRRWFMRRSMVADRRLQFSRVARHRGVKAAAPVHARALHACSTYAAAYAARQRQRAQGVASRPARRWLSRGKADVQRQLDKTDRRPATWRARVHDRARRGSAHP